MMWRRRAAEMRGVKTTPMRASRHHAAVKTSAQQNPNKIAGRRLTVVLGCISVALNRQTRRGSSMRVLDSVRTRKA